MPRVAAFGIAIIGFVFAASQTFAQEGVEVRAAKVCVGIGDSNISVQGPLHVEGLTVSGNANGTLTLRSSQGAILGNLPKGSYDRYVDCLQMVMRIIIRGPGPEPEPEPGDMVLGLHKFVKLTERKLLVGIVDFKTVPTVGDAIQVSIDGMRVDMRPGDKRRVPIYGGTCSIQLSDIDMAAKRATFSTDCDR